MLTSLRAGLLIAIFLGLAGTWTMAGDDPPSAPCLPVYEGLGYGNFPWGYYYLENSVPYYSLHPPVYYSYPVPRPYGYSPFAYPPGVRTPEITPPGPQIIQNRFVPRPTSTEPKSDKVTQKPLRIQNPFVAQADGSSPVQPADLDSQQTIRPQIVYPTRLSQPL